MFKRGYLLGDLAEPAVAQPLGFIWNDANVLEVKLNVDERINADSNASRTLIPIEAEHRF